MAHSPSFLFWICAHPRATVCDSGTSDDDFIRLCVYASVTIAPGDDWELMLTMGAKDS